MEDTYRQFLAAYPAYEHTRAIDELRAREFARLDRNGHGYLHCTGAGLYAESQVRRQAEMLTAEVLGNPHSASPTSQAATAMVEDTRDRVLRFFRATPDEY
jgi:selenocysteine lyase/cysteine desulfurase